MDAGRAPQIRVQYATTEDGVSIAYTATGSGPPLVYLQPHSHTLREWELPESREWYTLVAERHRLIRLDIRHFGLSQRDAGPITVDTCVADVEAVAGKLGLKRFDLMGVSGLSAAAVVYAARHPEQVRKLVLWAAAATGAAWSARQARVNSVDAVMDEDPDLALDLHTRFMFGERPPPRADQQQFVRHTMRPEDLVEYRQYYGRMDIASFLPQIQAPTLVVYPRRSEYMPMDAVRRIAALIRASEFVDCDTEMYPFQGPDQNRNLQIIETFLDPLTETGRVGAESHTPGQVVCELSPRELQVLALIAAARATMRSRRSWPST